MADAGTQLRVGRLTKAHGLKGAIKLELFTDDPERRFVPGAEFSLQVPASSPWHGKHLTLRELRWYNGHPVGFFEGVDDRTAAESLAKAILWVSHTETTTRPPNPTPGTTTSSSASRSSATACASARSRTSTTFPRRTSSS